MTASQPFDEPTPACGVCGVACERGYSMSIDPKTGKRYDYRCLDCAERERWVEYEQTRILRTRLLEDAGYEDWLRRNDYPDGWTPPMVTGDLLTEVIRAKEMLHEAAKTFECEVWFKGLQTKVRAAEVHGQRVETERLKWLVFTSAGRCLNTLEDLKDHHSITLITAEDGDECVMGVQGVEGRFEDVLELVGLALRVWESGPQVVADEKVRMLGM